MHQIILSLLCVFTWAQASSSMRPEKVTFRTFKADIQNAADQLIEHLGNPSTNIDTFMDATTKKFESSAYLFDTLKKIVHADNKVYAVIQDTIPLPERALFRLALLNNFQAQETLTKHLVNGSLYYAHLTEEQCFDKLKDLFDRYHWQSAGNALADIFYYGKLNWHIKSTRERFDRLMQMAQKGYTRARYHILSAIDMGLLGQQERTVKERDEEIQSFAENGWLEAQELVIRNLSFSDTTSFEEKLTLLRKWANAGWEQAQAELVSMLAFEGVNNGLSPQDCFNELHQYASKAWPIAQDQFAEAIFSNFDGQLSLSVPNKIGLLEDQIKLGSKSARFYHKFGLITGKLIVGKISLSERVKYSKQRTFHDEITIMDTIFEKLFTSKKPEDKALLEELHHYYPKVAEWLNRYDAEFLTPSFDCHAWCCLLQQALNGSAFSREVVAKTLFSNDLTGSIQNRLSLLRVYSKSGWPAARKYFVKALETGALTDTPQPRAARFLKMAYGILNTP